MVVRFTFVNMKKLLLPLISGLFLLSAQAQVAFPTDGAIWVNTFYTYTFNPPNPIPDSQLINVDNYCVNGEDTTISGNDYTKVFYCGDTYKGALREVNSVVFFVPADSTDEYLLYDFTAQQGQALNNVYVGIPTEEHFLLQDFFVNQVSTEIIGGVSRRVVYADQFRWIEGIGCETGLFMEPWANVSNYAVQLHCMSVNGTTLFPVEGSGDCSLTVGVSDAPASVEVSVYPNPTSELVSVQLNRPSDLTIELTDMQGRMISSESRSNTSLAELRLTGESGLYMVRVLTNDGNTSSFRVVKF